MPWAGCCGSDAARRRTAVLSQQLCGSGHFREAPAALRTVAGTFRGVQVIRKLLVANRGEVAIRVFRAAQELGIFTVAVYSEEDKLALHPSCADEAWPLLASAGSSDSCGSYLDAASVLAVAAKCGADAVHPGYGFLSEDAGFARACEAAGLIFVGPRAETVELLGDKTTARRLAADCGVPVPAGANQACRSAEELRQTMGRLGIGFPVMVKAAHGGGGRGLREVFRDEDLDEAFQRSASEALAACSRGEVFFEELLPDARHLEVQVLGDDHGGLVHLFERDCSAQIRHQKVLEEAPARGLAAELRAELLAHTLRLAKACGYRGAGTFEFLLSRGRLAFIEANPRLQVEHTVTEEAVGVDIVQAQLLIASGCTLSQIGLRQETVQVSAHAIQARVIMTVPGIIGAYREPSGRGVRVDSACFAGGEPTATFDPLLAKVVVSGPLFRRKDQDAEEDNGDSFELVRQRLLRALREFHVGGSIRTNLSWLCHLVAAEQFAHGEVSTSSLTGPTAAPGLEAEAAPSARAKLLDSSFDNNNHSSLRGASGQQLKPTSGTTPDGHFWIRSPLQGRVVSVDVAEGAVVSAGQQLVVVNAMKMEHVLSAPSAGRVRAVVTQAGASAAIGADLILMEEFAASGEQFQVASTENIDSNSPRVDLAEVLRRIRLTTDGGRSEHDKNFVKRLEDRHRRGQRSARENLEDLVDVDSFVEIGRLVVAAQRRRRDLEDLVRSTPADGLVAGFATINAGDFGDARARVAVVAYDYTVLAGTQGYYSHKKCDRMLELALEQRLPMVWFCEGGGGRPGDVDTFDVVGSGLTSALWTGLGRLSGLVPLVGLVSGRCFAGNAAALGCCDVVIAVEGSNIGMGGPAMIEGGGLGSVKPEEIGPLSVQLRNGVVDIAVSDEAAAVAAARRYLSYFQGSLPLQRQTGCSDQRLLRSAVPENRFRGYDMRPLIETLVDIGSWLELRSAFAIGVHTGLARIEGRPVGICANNPMHLGGALDADAALKASRFMELCDAFSLPLLFLCDTPGFMVGVESEDQASVRKMCRMFVVAASLTVPVVTIVTRKAYGLGAQAMFGGHSMGHKGLTVSWPTGEFGGMGLEGAVRLGFKKELESIPDPAEREQLFKTLTAGLLERGKALSTAALLEVDDVIDPADSRKLVLCSFAPEESQPRWHRKRPCIGTW